MYKHVKTGCKHIPPIEQPLQFQSGYFLNKPRMHFVFSLNGKTHGKTRFARRITSLFLQSLAVPCLDTDSYSTHCYWNTVNYAWVERDCTCTANQAWGFSGSYWRGKYRQATGKELIGGDKYCTLGNPIICSRHYMIGYLTRWPRCFRRESATAPLLRLWVRIPLGAWMSASCECCVLSGRGLCVGLITGPEDCHRVWWWSLDNEDVLAH